MFKHSNDLFWELYMYAAFYPLIYNPYSEDYSSKGLLWSHELGLSASEYMEDLDGCPIW